MENKIYIHIHVPKTAGSFIKYLSKNSPNTKIFYPFDTIHPEHSSDYSKTLSYLMKCHYNISFLKKYVPSINSSKVQLFSVVRNPYDRIYSLWKFCKKEGSMGSMSVFKVPDEFKDFVYELCDDEYLGQYFAQSQLFFLKGMEEYNTKIFKFEEMKILEKFLVDECNLIWEDTKRNAIPGVNYKDMYTPELSEMVKTKFKKEFEVFGYSTDLW
jgi:hypothetical protein